MFLPAPDESIWMGLLRLVLLVPHARSLKDKRMAVASVRDRVRARGGFCVAEVGHLDHHSRSILAISAISNDARHLRSLLDTLAADIEQTGRALVESRQITIFRPTPEENALSWAQGKDHG